MFRAQLEFYAEHYRPIGRPEFDAFCAGESEEARPGLLITFDDGLRSHAEVAAPLLEEFGFPGWFMVPTEFVDAPVAEQQEFAKEHQIQFEPEYDDPRVAMTWQQICALDGSHVIGCHTASHRRLEADLNSDELELEIVRARQRLEAKLGHSLDVFCWVGGEEWSYSRSAAQTIRDAGYRLSFMTNSAPILPNENLLQLQRSNIEAAMPGSMVRFSLSGLMDLRYRGKRNRVNQLTAG